LKKKRYLICYGKVLETSWLMYSRESDRMQKNETAETLDYRRDIVVN